MNNTDTLKQLSDLIAEISTFQSKLLEIKRALIEEKLYHLDLSLNSQHSLNGHQLADPPF